MPARRDADAAPSFGLAEPRDNAPSVHKLVLSLPYGSRREFWHRGTPADLGVIHQVFQSQDYSLFGLARGNELAAKFESLLSTGKRPLIVDAGANIGASVIWFASHFPRSHIVAFEPEPDNFQLLARNTYGVDIDLNNAAIGSADGRVAIIDPGQRSVGLPDAD